MARSNLRNAFVQGSGSPISAQLVFTDRVDESAAFERSRVELRELRQSGGASSVQDRGLPRRNVLCYFGVGGIGKSTLSQELERRFLSDPAGSQARRVAIRIDLAESASLDLEQLLLRLRAGLGGLGSHWSAFDIALSCYWPRAHPGEALDEFLDSSRTLQRLSKGFKTGDQVRESIAFVTSAELGGLPGLAQRAGAHLYRAIKRRVAEGRLLADCDLFEELIEADADVDTLSFFSYLLAWDLERLSTRGDDAPEVVVFLDTFEQVTASPSRELEKLLQRVIFLMPNVLFVITGRNRLDWAEADPAGELDFVGTSRWPHLHFSNRTDEPRQHLVGYLSDPDADSYLSEALVAHGGPAIDQEVRRRIIEGGGGLPLYLDLSVSYFVDLVASSRTPTSADFGGPFSAVVSRTIRDMSESEQELLRIAGTLPEFDADLLSAATPQLAGGRLKAFLRRPFLIHEPEHELPFSLHGSLRAALRQLDDERGHGWSEADRRRVAAAILERLGERISGDRSSSLRLLVVSLEISSESGITLDWQVNLVQMMLASGEWSTLSLPAMQSSAGELVRVIRAALLRRTGEPARSAAVLAEIAATTRSGPITALARLHQAHALRNLGEYSAAEALFQILQSSPFSREASYWSCDWKYLQGDFPSALEEVSNWVGGSAAEEAERLRLVGHILRVNAHFTEAAIVYESSLMIASTEGLIAAEAKALTNLAQTFCWTSRRPEVGELVARAESLLELVPNSTELVKLLSAGSIATLLSGGEPDLFSTRRLAVEVGYRGGETLADVVEALSGALAGDWPALLAAVMAIDERTRSFGGNRFWVPIVSTWLPTREARFVPEVPSTWLDPGAPTRWAGVLPR